jgi:pyruvate dehydrogenase E2 component (dihydrolipoamide acetyltransferase)
MSKEIIMPKLSDTMEEGTFISWRKTVGEKVDRGDIVAEIETDKANMELEAFDSGILLETRAKAGEVVPVGTVIGLIGEPGEKTVSKPGGEPVKKEAVTEKTPPGDEEIAPKPEDKIAEPEKLKISDTGKEKVLEPEKTTGVSAGEEEPREVGKTVVDVSAVEEKASPMVRRMAREKGVDLGDVNGTGPNGRILMEDLEKYLKGQGKVEKEPVAAGSEAQAGAKKTEPLTRMRTAIAKNVTASWRTIPHFSVGISVDMGEAERLKLGARAAGVSLSLNDIITKALAMTLLKFPRLNASFSEEGINLYSEVNIGIAVSIEDGLLVPVIRGCEKLSLKDIASNSRDLIERARHGKISENDITGGTFTLSNLGMFGVDEFSAVIYPGQAAILAVAAVHEAVVVREEGIVKARLMNVTLSADHRIVDGADAARFLSELKKSLENPFAMLV